MVAPRESWMPIRELSRRLGVSADLLRKWERRYGVLRPDRTVGNQRLYSRLDEARARVMLRHVRSGMAPAQAAEVAIATRFKITPNGRSQATQAELVEARMEMQTALERYDETAAERAFETLLAASAPLTVVAEIFLPYLHEIGERWAERDLDVAQEHFASGFIHGRMLAMARGWDRGLGPRALLACPGGERHVLGLIAFGIALREVGWRITYLGAETPVRTVAQAAAAVAPRLTVLSAVSAARFAEELRELRELSAQWTVAIGGAGATATLASTCGAEHLAGDPLSAAKSLVS